MTISAFIVEDSAALRDSLVEALSELAGITTVGTASSESDAVAWLRQPANQWRLAIVDLLLESWGSGLGVLRATRERSPSQKVVVLTATTSPAIRAQCLALGCDAVFDKAMESEALIAWCAQLSAAEAPQQRGAQAF